MDEIVPVWCPAIQTRAKMEPVGVLQHGNGADKRFSDVISAGFLEISECRRMIYI
jgi:hypothetical protein